MKKQCLVILAIFVLLLSQIAYATPYVNEYDQNVKNRDALPSHGSTDAEKIANASTGFDQGGGDFLDGFDRYPVDSTNYQPSPTVNWNEPHTMGTVPPAGQANMTNGYAADYTGLRNSLENLSGSMGGATTIPVQFTYTSVQNVTLNDIADKTGMSKDYLNGTNGANFDIEGNTTGTLNGYYQKNADGSWNLVLYDKNGVRYNGEYKIDGIMVSDGKGGWVKSTMSSDLLDIYFSEGSTGRNLPSSDPASPNYTGPRQVPNSPPLPSPIYTPPAMIQASRNVSNIPYTHMTTSPSGTIVSSDGKYDATVRIPTSENLTYTAKTDDVLYDINTRQHNLRAWASNVAISANFTYHKQTWDTWLEPDGSHTEWKQDPVTGQYTQEEVTDYKSVSDWVDHPETHSKSDTYSYSTSKTYYDVNKSGIYPAQYAIVKATQGSYVLQGKAALNGPGGPGAQTISTYARGGSVGTTRSASCDLGHNGVPDGRHEGELNAMLDSIRGSIRSACESAIGLESGSCDYTYKNLHVTTTSHNFTAPGWGTISGSDGPKMIPDYYPNGLYHGNCTAYYGGGYCFSGAINDVFVHTPVVAQNITIKATPFVNQKVTTDPNINYLQLDEGFSITFPNKGTHVSNKGYGTRLYNSYQAVTAKVTDWGEIKDVKLPFDVYVYSSDGKATYYLPKGNWLSEHANTKGKNVLVSDKTAGTETINFLVPVWAKEGLYNEGTNRIQIRIAAENAFDKDRKQIADRFNKMEQGANLNVENYVAIGYFSAEVIGKIYDFNVLDSSDPGWTGKGGTVVAGGFIPLVSAQNLPYGVTKTPVATKVATTSQNRTQTYNYAQKLGYTFVFDFKTKGRNTTNVTIGTAGTAGNEEFYFIGKNTNTVKSVYLYYKDADGVYKKIKSGMGSDYKTKDLEVNLNDAFMKVTPQEKTDTNRIYVAEKVAGAPFNYALKINIGTLATLNIPKQLRFAYNNMNEYKTDAGGKGLYKQTEANIISHAADAVTKTYGFTGESGKDLVTGSIGHWYVGYALPASTVAVDPSKIPSGSTEADIDRTIKTNPGSIVLKGGYIGVGFNFNPTVPTNLDYNGPEYTKADGSIPNKDEKSTLLKGGSVTEGQLTKPTRNWVDATGSTIPGVPNDVVVLYETDFSTTIDNKSVLAK